MKLTQLLLTLSDAEILHLPKDTDVSGVTCDSRQVNPGFVFVAIPGALTDGHLYIEEAIRRGAVAIVVERPQSLDKVAEIKVPNARRALAELSRRFFHYPDLDLFMVGVTATNGKTTTTSMVQHILRSYGIETAVIGSVAYSYGDVRVKSNLTTPESSDLHAMLAEQRDDGVKVVSMEVSSIAEAQYRVYGINYDIVCFLNITPDHMPDHGTFEQYYLEKLKLVERVSEGVPVILNRDDPHVYEARQVTPGDVITISIDHRDVTITADSLKMAGGIPSFKYTVLRPFRTLEGERESGSWQVNLKVAGRHSVYNAMAAITICSYYGIEVEDAIRAIERFTGVERRLQIIYDGDFTIIDDHISDEDNTLKMLEALEVISAGRPVHIVVAIRGNRGVLVNREVIAQFAKFRDKINWKTFYVTSSVDTARPRDVVHDDEREAVLSDLTTAGYNYTYEPNLTESIVATLPVVKPGEVYVLAGSHNMDKGARIALNYLADSCPDLDREEILKPLRERLMG
jgi:UDP-N-acetylmuramoyl-L-alanyl-D-glutamate--2,6-diaminopimelate ligase